MSNPTFVDIETVTFESDNELGWFIRHISFLGMLSQFLDTPNQISTLNKTDATFIMRRPGLSATEGSVSFESVNYLGYFLRHQNFRLKLQRNDGTDLFHNDASFVWRQPTPGQDNRDLVSLESVNFPGHFIRHQNFELWLAPPTAGDTETFKRDTRFIPWPGFRPLSVQTVSYQSVNYQDTYIRHSFFLGVLNQISSVLDKTDSSFIIRQPGLTGTEDAVSFESVNYPGHYLRHQNFRLKLQRDDGTDVFHRDASFRRRPALNPGHANAQSLESVNFPGYFIRHQNFELWLARPDAGNTVTYPADASFIPLEGFVGEPLPCGVNRVGAASAIPPGPVAVPTFINTERVGQLTGSTDPEGLPILNNTGAGEWSGAGFAGVDLGNSVEHNGRLYIFFGDVVGDGAQKDPKGPDRTGADLVGWTTDTVLKPGGFTLHPVKGPDGWFDPFKVNNEILPLDRTPSGGFSYKVKGKNKTYVFALQTLKNPDPNFPTTVLCTKDDPALPGTYKLEFTFSYQKFWSVNPTVVTNAKHPGLPSQEGEGLILLAGGWQDEVHLAWMQLDPDHGPLLSTVRYYQGGGDPQKAWTDPLTLTEEEVRMNGAESLKEQEKKVKAVVKLPPYFSTVSATWLPDAERWILLYSTAVFYPHIPPLQKPTLPIVARFGVNPWTWSDEVEVFNPCRDLAFGHFIHWTGLDDIDLRVPPRVTDLSVPAYQPRMPHDIDAWALERGHPYGALILNRFTKWDPSARELTLAYLLSTFNPYQVQVMRTRLRLP